MLNELLDDVNEFIFIYKRKSGNIIHGYYGNRFCMDYNERHNGRYRIVMYIVLMCCDSYLIVEVCSTIGFIRIKSSYFFLKLKTNVSIS